MIETSAMVVDTTAMQHTKTVCGLLLHLKNTDSLIHHGYYPFEKRTCHFLKKREKRKEKEEVVCSNCIQMLGSFWYLKYVFSWKWQATVCFDLPFSDASCTSCSSEAANQPMPFKKTFSMHLSMCPGWSF
jgi:hypothetical protein